MQAFLLSAALFVLAAPEQDRLAVSRTQLSETNYGFFMEAHGGYWGTLSAPASPGTPTGFSSGYEVRVDLGWDIGRYVSPSLFLNYRVNYMGSDYTGYSTSKLVSGAYQALLPGAAVKVRFVGISDAQGVQRTWFYARLAAAAVFYFPKSLIGQIDVAVSGGLGVEYYTKLRHFSIGLEANFSYMVMTSTMGFSVVPSLKYTF